MFSVVADWIFGCSHRHTSFPITVRRSTGNGKHSVSAETYVVCLDCGKRFAYDWAEMRVTKQPVVVPESIRAGRGSGAGVPLPAANRLLHRLVHHT